MFRMILWGNKKIAGKLDKLQLAGLTNTPSTGNWQKPHWNSLSMLALTKLCCDNQLMARENSGSSHLSILHTCCLSFSPQTKVHPPGRDHPRCLLNTTTQHPLENRLVQIQAPVYDCCNEYRSQKLHCHYNFLPDWNKDGVVQDCKLKTLGSSVRRVSKSLLPGLAKSNQQVRSELCMVSECSQAVSGCISPSVAFHTQFWSGKTGKP